MDSFETLILCFLAIFDSALIFVQAIRAMSIADYQLEKISVFQFTNTYNYYRYFFMCSEFFLSIFSISKPTYSFSLFLTIFPIFVYEFQLFRQNKLKVDVLWATKSLNTLKIISIIKILLFFFYLIICILKLLFSSEN